MRQVFLFSTLLHYTRSLPFCLSSVHSSPFVVIKINSIPSSSVLGTHDLDDLSSDLICWAYEFQLRFLEENWTGSNSIPRYFLAMQTDLNQFLPNINIFTRLLINNNLKSRSGRIDTYPWQSDIEIPGADKDKRGNSHNTWELLSPSFWKLMKICTRIIILSNNSSLFKI